MLKTLTLVALGALVPAAASAESITIQYPAEACYEIVSQEYSTGGGNSAVQYLEILCKDVNGKYTGYVTQWGSVAGFFGAGRWDMPEKFIYEPYNGTVLHVK